MGNELWKMTAVEAVARLKKKDISPLDLVEASARRIADVEPAVNALPTLCLDRAREHAKRLMRGEGREAEREAGWLGGIPVAIKDLADVSKSLKKAGWNIIASEIRYVAKSFTELSEADHKQVTDFLTLLDDHDDVHRVYATIK